MRLTIIPSDKTVVVNGEGRTDLALDLSSIPDDVHALQWNVDTGFIEFATPFLGIKPANESITELPQWALDCVAVHAAQVAEENKPLTTEQIIVVNRHRRDSKLTQSDWTQGVDSPLSDAKKTEWAAWRQQLRDLTDVPGWLETDKAPFPPAPSN